MAGTVALTQQPVSAENHVTVADQPRRHRQAISPNADTRMIASIPPEGKEQLAAGIPWAASPRPPRWPSQLFFLASDEAAYITGVVLPLDGGISI